MFYDGFYRPIDPAPPPRTPAPRVPGEAFLRRFFLGYMLFLLVLPISAGTMVDMIRFAFGS